MIYKVANYKDGQDIKVEDKFGKEFYMVFAGSLDLYWVKQSENSRFVIHKLDAFTYDVFNRLFNKLKKEDKKGELIRNNTFTWVSEAYGEKHTQNTLQIIKKPNEYEIVFNHNSKHIAPKDYTSVCFCNST